MALRFSPAPLLTHSATPPTHPAKAVMVATAAMAAAPHDGFDHVAIPNDDALSWLRVPHGPEAAVGWRPPRAEGATAPRAAERRRPYRPRLTKGVGHEERVAMGQREGVAVGARGPRAAESALGPKALVSSHG